LTIGNITNKLTTDEKDPTKIKVVKDVKLTLTAAATVFEEELLSNFLADLSKFIEQPFSISL
jgi:hypothetical protein